MKALMSATMLAAALWLQPAWAHVPNEGRLLASNCFQCHGTNGRGGGFDELAGKRKSELLHELNEMRVKSARSNIMNAHAHGYSSEQLALIANYFSRLPKP